MTHIEPQSVMNQGKKERSFSERVVLSLSAVYRRSPWIIFAMLVLSLVAVLLHWDEYESGKRVQETNNAYIHFDTIIMEAKVSGYVRDVAFTDFQEVQTGDVLVTLVDDDFRMAVLQAEAKRDHAAATLSNLDLEIELQDAYVEQAKAVMSSAEAKLDLAQRENRRLSRLVKQGAVATHEAETAEANLKTALAAHQESVALVCVQERKLALLRADRSLREADLKAGEASLENARIDLRHTRITVPVASKTGSCKIREGELVKAGAQIVTLVPDASPYVIANYKETQLTRLRVGQRAVVRVDTFPGEELTGRVASISPATGATFSLLPNDNTSGNFTKVVQRIPVRIEFDPGQTRLTDIRAGMSVVTRIDTESRHE